LLEPEDVIVHEFDVASLSSMIGRALEIRRPAFERAGPASTWTIGSHSAFDATGLPMVLTIQIRRTAFRSVVSELLLRLESPFILLSPTARRCDPRTAALLARHGCGFVPLDEGFGWDESTESFQSITSVVRLGRAPNRRDLSHQVNRFVFEEGHWTISYGERTARFEDSNGFHFLHVLVASPGIIIPIAGLLAAVDGGPPVVLGSAGEILDAQAIRAYEGRLREIESELATIAQNRDRRLATALTEEAAFIERELASARGLNGRTRLASNDLDRARRRVRMAVNRAISRIAGPLPDLSRHLEATVRIGHVTSYLPENEVTWVV